MAFIDDVSKTITDFSQAAIRKTKDIAELMKLNSEVSSQEYIINDMYRQIGKLYYESNKESHDDVYSEFFENIGKSTETIKIAREKIKIIKDYKVSKKTENSACCEDPAEAVDVEYHEVNFCPKCGCKSIEGMNYCAKCGCSLNL
jgi:hypothetical protein